MTETCRYTARRGEGYGACDDERGAVAERRLRDAWQSRELRVELGGRSEELGVIDRGNA